REDKMYALPEKPDLQCRVIFFPFFVIRRGKSGCKKPFVPICFYIPVAADFFQRRRPGFFFDRGEIFGRKNKLN
ncbi:MAG: hypothetical protein ACI4XQ_07935, partial [Eubacteriales bacterium]